MAEEKIKTTLDKIEKLIVDGQKEVLERIDKVEERLEGRIDGVENGLGQQIKGLKQDIQTLHEKIEHKLDEHICLPSHV